MSKLNKTRKTMEGLQLSDKNPKVRHKKRTEKQN
jgi:hypothetical protein